MGVSKTIDDPRGPALSIGSVTTKFHIQYWQTLVLLVHSVSPFFALRGGSSYVVIRTTMIGVIFLHVDGLSVVSFTPHFLLSLLQLVGLL